MEGSGWTPPAAVSAAGVQEGLLDIVCLVRVRGADSYHGCLGRVALSQGGCAHPSGIVWYCWLVKEARHGSKQRHGAYTHTAYFRIKICTMSTNPLWAFEWIFLSKLWGENHNRQIRSVTSDFMHFRVRGGKQKCCTSTLLIKRFK